MILGSKALAWLYLSWPIQAEMFPKQHLKAPPPCTDKSYFGPSTAPVHRFTDLASAGSEFLQPPNSTRARAVQPPPPPHPTPLHSFQDGGSKDTAKAPSTGCETPESPHTPTGRLPGATERRGQACAPEDRAVGEVPPPPPG